MASAPGGYPPSEAKRDSVEPTDPRRWDAIVYVSGIDGFLYAFDGSGGAGAVQVAWRQPQFESEEMPPVVGGPGLDEAGGIIAVGSEDGGLYAYNALTGENLHWSPFRTDGKVWSTPVLRNGVAYFGSQDGSVYAVSMETGALVWRFDTGGAVVATPLVHKNLLIVGSFDRQLYALGLNDGQPRWQIEADNWWWATPVSSGPRDLRRLHGRQRLRRRR